MLPNFNNSKKLTDHKYLFAWRTFPAGVRRETFSKIDALLEIVALETGERSRSGVVKQLGFHSATVSRSRATNTLTNDQLMRAAIYSGAPYMRLCEVFDMEPCVYPVKKEEK